MISLDEQAAVAEDRWNSMVGMRVTIVFMRIGVGRTPVWAAILAFWATTGCGPQDDHQPGYPAVKDNARLDLRVVAASDDTSAGGVARIGPGELLNDPSGRAWYVSDTYVISTDHLEGGQARVEPSNPRGGKSVWMVVVPLSREGARRLREWTGQNIGKGIGIIINGELVFAGTVGGAFGSPLRISDFSRDEAEALAATLRELSRAR